MPKHAHEDVEQGYLFQWAARQECIYPELSLLHHIPNEGKRSLAAGARQKKARLEARSPGYLFTGSTWNLSWFIHRT